MEERGYIAPYYVAIASPLLPEHLKQCLSQEVYTQRILNLNRVLYRFKSIFYVIFWILLAAFAAMLVVIWWFTSDRIFGCRLGDKTYYACVQAAFPAKFNVTVGMSCSFAFLIVVSYFWLINRYRLKFLRVVDETVKYYSKRDRSVTWFLSPVIAPYGIYERDLLTSLNTKNSVEKFRVGEVKSFEIHVVPRTAGSAAIPSAPILQGPPQNESGPESAPMPPAYV